MFTIAAAVTMFTLTMTVIEPAPDAPLGVTTEKTHSFDLTASQCEQMKKRFYDEAVKYGKSIVVDCRVAKNQKLK
jgi:hypothetical protein